MTKYDDLNIIYKSTVKKCKNLMIKYNSYDNIITGTKDEYAFIVSRCDDNFKITFKDKKYDYILMFRGLYEVINFILAMSSNQMNIERVDNCCIKVKGIKQKNKKKSLLKQVLLTVVAGIIIMFSLLMLAVCCFEEIITIAPLFLGAIILSVELIRYGALQCRYRKNIFMFVFGMVIVSFGLSLILTLSDEYLTYGKYELADYIGTMFLFLLVISGGVCIIYLSCIYKKRSRLIVYNIMREPILPPEADVERLTRAVIERYVREEEVIKLEQEFTDDEELFSSKLGGIPYWDISIPYPVSSTGEKMLMVAQIRLDMFPDNDYLPKSGLLQFFVYDADGIKESRVVYHKSINPNVTFEDILNIGVAQDIFIDTLSDSDLLKFIKLDNPLQLSFEKTKFKVLRGAEPTECMFKTAAELGINLEESLNFYELFDKDIYSGEKFDYVKNCMLRKVEPSSYNDMLLFGAYILDYDEEIYASEINFYINSQDLLKNDYSRISYSTSVEYLNE